MWALSKQVYDKLEQASASGFDYSREKAIEISAFIGWDASDVFAVKDGLGIINVVGVLTNEPNPMAAIFGDGNTTYSAIAEAIIEAEADENVKEIVFAVDSPGGEFSGMLETMEAIRTSTKPTRAEVGSMAASAGFGLAASADKLVATAKAAEFGSVGIVQEFRVNSDTVTLTNTGSPNKRPDASTEEGQAVLTAHLDDAFDLFAEAIGESRGIEASGVAEKFGKGGTFFAEKALSMGMVDSVEISKQNTSQSSTPTKAESVLPIVNEPNNDKGVPMDLATLEKDHPELAAQLRAEGEKGASTNSVDAERIRVAAHMGLAKDSGDMKFALECIADGTEITPAVATKHVMSASKKAGIESRQGDDLNLENNNDDDTVDQDKAAAKGILAAASLNLNMGA